MDERIHDILWASQPDIQIRCTKAWDVPAWLQPTLPPGVYLAKDNGFYTFDADKVTCPECIKAVQS